MRLMPVKDHIIVRAEELPDKVGSIVIPDAAKRNPPTVQAEVVATNALPKKGTRVLFRIMDSIPFEFNDEKLYSIEAKKIIATIEED